MMQEEADIYVIQECEDPAQCKDKKYQEWASNSLWIGDSKNKGVGIFCMDIRTSLERLDWSNVFRGHPVKHFLAAIVDDRLQILCVWTHKSPL